MIECIKCHAQTRYTIQVFDSENPFIKNMCLACVYREGKVQHFDQALILKDYKK